MQWLKVVYKMASFSLFSDVWKKYLEEILNENSILEHSKKETER